ncbi:T9SS type A sorting domain-containing protein, partial [bacterium]|nr:T9SS type A sorting domain-containing protein [bacterium]
RGSGSAQDRPLRSNREGGGGEMKSLACIFLLLLPLTPQAKPANTFSQAIQLETGWNLVSWYLEPDDPGDPPLTMDDLFDTDDLPWGPQSWFYSEYSTEPTDKVGTYNQSPYNPPTFYPEFGKDNTSQPWPWNPRQAYAIYLDSPAHFWDFTNAELYDPPTPPPGDDEDDFIPNIAWDDFEQVGLPVTAQTTYWYFISYPLRKQIKLEDSQTIAWLRNYSNNPLVIIQDDDGHCFIPSLPDRTTLEYLKPGKGYYLGFTDDAEIEDCPWFFNEGAVPEYVPPSPKDTQQTISSSNHFTFKDRTHWWYPVVIDTIMVEEMSPDPGDEIAVFCNGLCVGAEVFDGTYPIYLAAWMDNIATQDQIDGYLVNNEMTFIWYDVSENSEITFNPPPMTATSEPEANPYFPTHSGFGYGFAAHRTLGYGVQEVNHLPKTYSLRQNYPNPFNAETVIPLELPQRSRVRIDLYNIKGQLVDRISDSVFIAGKVQIRYNARNLASGMYFYHVMAEGLERGGTFNDVCKMLLIK